MSNLKCIICLSNPETPSICPSCSKLFCYNCIFQWVQERFSCPNCRNSLSMDKLVKIRWFDEISQIQKNKNESTGEEYCKIHEKGLDFYCNECKICVCIDCMDESYHESHQFQKIAKIYEAESTKFLNKTEEMRDYICRLEKVFKNIDQNVNEIVTQREFIMDELTSAFDRETSIVKSIFKKKSKELIDQKTEIRFKIESMNKEIDTDYEAFGTTSRTKFLNKSAQIIKKCDTMMSVPIQPFQKQTVQFRSELVPLKEIRKFSMHVKDFSESISHNRKFRDNLGIQWMIEININEPIVTAQFKNLDGIEQPFKCFVVIKHLLNTCLDIEAKYEDMMINGTGMVEEVVKIANIKSDGYLEESRMLKIEYAVLPMNMQRCSKAFYETTIKKLNHEIESLKKRRFTNNSNSTLAPEYMPKLFTSNLVLKKDPTKPIWISDQFRDENGSVWLLKLFFVRGYNKIGYSLKLLAGVENIQYELQIIHPPMPVPFMVTRYLSTLDRFIDLLPQRDCTFPLAKMEHFSITLLARALQHHDTMLLPPLRPPNAAHKRPNEKPLNCIKKLTLKSTIFETLSKDSIVYNNLQGVVWELTITAENLDGKCILKGEFRDLNGTCDNQTFKFSIVIKHPKDESLNIVTEYEDTISNGKGLSKILTDKTSMEEKGFLVDNNDSIVIEYFTQPISLKNTLMPKNRGHQGRPEYRERANINQPRRNSNNRDVRQSEDFHDMKIDFKKVDEKTWKSDVFHDNFNFAWEIQINLGSGQKIDYVLKMIRGVENVRYDYKITYPPTEKKFYQDKFVSPIINECVRLCQKGAQSRAVDNIDNLRIFFKIRPADEKEKQKILDGMRHLNQS